MNTEEAKERLRAATPEFSLRAWVMRRKWRLLGLALVSGYVAGRLPGSAGAALLRHSTPLLLTALQQRREEQPD